MNGPVICGVEDWSDEAGSSRAVAVARRLAERFDRPLLFVNVVERPPGDGGSAAVLQHAAARSAGVDAAWTVLTGHPADSLVTLAGEREASFVVVGCRGPRASLLGSVSVEVSRRAPCPVVVVPPTADPEVAEGERRSALAGGIARLDLTRNSRTRG